MDREDVNIQADANIQEPIETEAKAPQEPTTPQESQDSIHNIFDSVFRTIVEYLPELVIPLINEVFHTAYAQDTPIDVKKNEHYTWGGKFITDLFFELNGRFFHVECQSTTDGRMIIRIMEYAMSIALENASENEDGSFTIKFPSSCVIYLRSTNKTPDKLVMHVEFPDGENVAVDVPLLKVKEYTKEQLFQKDLLLLLPYYLMRYEDDCKEAGKLENQEEADRRMSVFMEECEDLLGRLSSRCSEKEQQYMFQTLADLIIEIAMYLAPKNEKEKVRNMGGTVIETRAQILREEGEEKKARETAKKLQQRGNTPADIADIVGYAVEVVEKWLGLTPAQKN